VLSAIAIVGLKNAISSRVAGCTVRCNL